ncbi:myrosinase 1-like [Neodiprion pinetum]|uniref:myrosinase 1-like n=1 Tax=Neodiprion pinetum TaxID=441929 RepID=UPI001EE0B455|nr:myrosinase 1-like [Neodiprion pinetum]
MEHYISIMKHTWKIVICCIIFTGLKECQAANLSFPGNFTIGVATSSYQIEGAWNVSDKAESIWDWYTHSYPENIADGSNGDIACDSYHKYEEDIQWLKELGVDFYRFSVSWARILPNGFANEVSEDGLQYYKNLTQALIDNGIEPVVTIYHWEHPKILEDLGGWTNELMVTWYADYARIIFEELGPLVKTFVTINEPESYCAVGYNTTYFAPGKELENMGHYICMHNSLKAHATVYHMYDDEYRSTQNGQIGIVAQCYGWVAGDNVTDDSIERYFQFNCGWVMHPIFVGDYPEIMKTRIANISALQGYPFSRLPEFSDEWIEYINGTADFFGLNHYTSRMPVFDSNEDLGIYTIDSGIIASINESWSLGSAAWLHVVPAGFGNLLRMIRDQYNNPPVWVLENGYPDTGESDDYSRISYYYEYITELLTAFQDDGCNVVRYTIWSLLDEFEWTAGYTQLFGIVGVDFDSSDRTRSAKLSTAWWQEVISTRTLQSVPTANSTR